jgi:hypothetical protein
MSDPLITFQLFSQMAPAPLVLKQVKIITCVVHGDGYALHAGVHVRDQASTILGWPRYEAQDALFRMVCWGLDAICGYGLGTCLRQMFENEALQKWPVDATYVADVVSRFADHLSSCDDVRCCPRNCRMHCVLCVPMLPVLFAKGLHDLLATQLLLSTCAGGGEPDTPSYASYTMTACTEPFVVQVARRVDKLALRVWPATFELVGFCTRHAGVCACVLSSSVCCHVAISCDSFANQTCSVTK